MIAAHQIAPDRPVSGVNPCTAYFEMTPGEIAESDRQVKLAQADPAAASGGLQTYQGHGWQVTSRTNTTILDAHGIACWEKELNVTALPDMIYPQSVLTLRHIATGTALHFDAHDALAAAARGWADAGESARNDAEFKCEFAAAWRSKAPPAPAGPQRRAAAGRAAHAETMPPPPAAPAKGAEHDHGIEWTYRTPYVGTLRRVPSAQPPPEPRAGGEIDWQLLRDQSQPILSFCSLDLFEDELADCGLSKLSLKFRFMPSCWFVLLRQFVRVDRVRVWIRDVRLFHRHGSDHFVEETTVRSQSIRDMSGRPEDFAAAHAAAEAGGEPPVLKTYSNVEELAQTVPVVGRGVRTIPL